MKEKTLEEAALDYAAAKGAVDTHPGEKKGPEFAEKVALWRAATLELCAAGLRHAGSAK